jgi:hypothetical protein
VVQAQLVVTYKAVWIPPQINPTASPTAPAHSTSVRRINDSSGLPRLARCVGIGSEPTRLFWVCQQSAEG